MQRIRDIRAFTLAELLVGLIVTSILLSAVATLAFALSSATRASDEAAYTQTQLRTAAPRLFDLIRYSRMVCAEFDDTLTIWRADANRNDLIDVNELVYLEYDGTDHVLKLWEFLLDSSENTDVLTALGLPSEPGVLVELAKAETKTALVTAYPAAGSSGVREISLLRGCSQASFTLAPAPPRTTRVTISFTLAGNEGDHPYEIDATMRVSAQHLLNDDATKLIDDDD